jgi:hypothetical protein
VDIRKLLAGRDRRSIGRANQAAALACRNPALLGRLLRGLWAADASLRMRAADALEKATRTNPAPLQRFKKELLGLLEEAEQHELRWHLAAMIPRLALTPAEISRAANALERYLDDRSSIVKTSALQALADLVQQQPAMRTGVVEHLRRAVRTGTPAMKARSRKLLAKLDRD